MSVKLTGAEYKRFLGDPDIWGPNDWMEDVSYEIDGKEVDSMDVDEDALPDTVRVKITGGTFCVDNLAGGHKTQNYEALVKKWLKSQSEATISIVVKKEFVNDLTTFLLKAEGVVKILK